MANIVRFNADIARFAESIDADFASSVKVYAIRALRGIVEQTPVDTGRARGAWAIGVNASPSYTADRLVVKGAPAPASEVAKLEALNTQPFSLVIIGNNLPYAQALENGSSSQTPAGMVATTLANLRAFPE